MGVLLARLRFDDALLGAITMLLHFALYILFLLLLILLQLQLVLFSIFAMLLNGSRAAKIISHFFMITPPFMPQCCVSCVTAAIISLCDIKKGQSRSAPNLS